MGQSKLANQTISCQHSTTEEVLSDIESLSYLAGWEKSECLQLHAGRLKTLCGQATVGLTRLLSVSPSVTLLDRGVYNGAETAISMIIGGESAIWVLLASGDEEKDSAAQERLNTELARLQGSLKMRDV